MKVIHTFGISKYIEKGKMESSYLNNFRLKFITSIVKHINHV